MRGGNVRMKRLAGYAARFAVLMILMTGAAIGQQQTGNTSAEAAGTRNFSGIGLMQDAKAAPQSGPQNGLGAPAAPIAKPAVHKFWDKENILLFAGVGAA